jgi:SAM-dependent methyltransferase
MRKGEEKRLVETSYDLIAAAYLATKEGYDPDTYAPLEQLITRLPGGAAVLDLGCGAGVPVSRRLAQQFAVTGVDISEDCIAIAEKLTQLCGMAGDKLLPNVQLICCSADAVPLPDESFTVAWSQCSFPSDLSWLREIRRLLVPGGRVAFTGLIRRSDLSDASLRSLDEIRAKVSEFGFHVISAEDISEMDLEYGWYPLKRKLRDNDAHYCSLMGEAWVRQAYAELDIDTESWRSGREGNGRIVAVKE